MKCAQAARAAPRSLGAIHSSGFYVLGMELWAERAHVDGLFADGMGTSHRRFNFMQF